MPYWAEWILLFTIYSLLGWICESTYCSILAKKFVNRGFLNGPFCPIYGVGALLIVKLLSPFSHNLVILFFASLLLTSLLEYLTADHSGSVAKLLEKNPNITVVCTTAAQKYLRAIANHDFPCIVAKHGDKLDIGGQELEFIVAPLLHWPDSMFTWMPQQKVLFTCDFLGAHFCEPTMLDSNIHYPEQYLGEVNYYYACIFGPFKPYVLAGLDKIKDLPRSLPPHHRSHP